MNMQTNSPGPRGLKWFYYLTMAATIFSGMGQMPILKRYYVTDLPLMGWSDSFYTLSNLHYVGAALFMALLAWRLFSPGYVRPDWGPKSWWGWLLVAALVISGALKAARNTGTFLDPTLLMILDFTHLFSAMAFMFTGLAVLISRLPLASRQRA